MNARTSILLLLALGGLVAFAVWKGGSAPTAAEDGVAERALLFEGVDPAAVDTVRLEHARRGLQIAMERRGSDWWIIDPIEHPADKGVMGLLLQIVEFNTFAPPAGPTPERADVGLDPPRGRMVVEGEGADGERFVERVLMGAPDLDDRHVWVEVDGRVGRTVRNLLNTLMRNVDEFRPTRAILLEPGPIVEVHRTGYTQASPADPRVDLTLHAIRDGERWLATAPITASLDPNLMTGMARASTFLRIARHIEDAPPDPSVYGLQPHWWRIALRPLGGEEGALLFGRPSVESGRWLARREGLPAVFEVDGRQIGELMRPVGELLDRRALQSRKADLTSLEWTEADGGVRLARDGGTWTASVRVDDAWQSAGTADATLVARFLDRLARTTLDDPRWGDDAPAPEPVGTLKLTGADGVEVLALAEDPHRAAREGEDVHFALDPWLFDALRRPVDAWLSLQLLEVDEVRVVALELARDGTTARWERSERGIWTRAGEDEEARQLLKVLDALLFLRGRGVVPEDAGPLDRAIEGRFLRDDGSTIPFAVGLAEDDEGVVREAAAVDGRRAYLDVVGLHARLAGLVAD